MEQKILKIELSTRLGVFTFEKHWDSDIDFVKAMRHFVANNHALLGETSYKVFTLWPDGDVTEARIDGINASAHLEQYLEGMETA